MLPPTKYSYVLTEAKRQQFAGMYLLRKMVKEKRNFSIVPEGDDFFLEGTLGWLYSENWVEINVKKGVYQPSEKGREHLKLFEERYQDFLKVFYALRFVSLKETQVAFEYYYSVPEAEFTAFTRDTAWEWEDVRLAAAEYKNMDGLEVVFMSYLNEGQFDKTTCPQGWQFDLHAGLTFAEMVKTANSLLHADQLGNPEVSSEDVLKAIILKCGEVVMMNLHHEEKLRQEREAEQARQAATQVVFRTPQAEAREVVEYRTVVTEEVVVETTCYPVVYYNSYAVDPFYVSPIWYTPWYF